MTISYPKRLIEVDLPIKRISAHARREKNIHQGNISTLHTWWARRPLAACRAVTCAALWPDPADPLCPEAFCEVARTQMLQWATKYSNLLSPENFKRFNALLKAPSRLNDPLEVRQALLDFIADFANWDNSSRKAFLETSQILTQAAHEALGGEPGTKPLVVDPFAGGGAIPLEALRVGADAFASDLNPVAVLLNKVILEYFPKYGQQLADEVRRCGQIIKQHIYLELGDLFPADPSDNAKPIAYLWARTILSEAPDDGTGLPMEIPLLRSLWLAKKGRKRALRWIRNDHGQVQTETIKQTLPDGTNRTIQRPLLEVFEPKSDSEVGVGTVRSGAATCPVTGYTTSADRVKRQLISQAGGSNTARLFAVYVETAAGREFRLPTNSDLQAFQKASRVAEDLQREDPNVFPTELINPIRPYKNSRGLSAVTRIGCQSFSDLYNKRQALTIYQLYQTLNLIDPLLFQADNLFKESVKTVLALAIDRIVSQNTSVSRWDSSRSTIKGAFSKQALAVVWDFAEANPFSGSSADWDGAIEWVIQCMEANKQIDHTGQAIQASATQLILPDGSVSALITDPPYFAAIPYADLSDFFYVWLRRGLKTAHPSLFDTELTKKGDELIVTNAQLSGDGRKKDDVFFQDGMATALMNVRKAVVSHGLGVVVYAEGTTTGWEAILSAIIKAGWAVTASWPIDTEMENRTQAQDAASLQSSVHLVCRPRENKKSLDNSEKIGDWRDVLEELPQRIHEWMPRLVAEGIAGADAIFACLGPAVEIFSRYSHVEKASGDQVTLQEYLEYVWAAVAREALSRIFEGVDTTGFDEDARITALWLWTLFSGTSEQAEPTDEEDSDEDEEAPASKAPLTGGYVLEFDAARKIAQGLGVHLERMTTIVEVKAEKARLLPVAERARYLFGKETTQPVTSRRKKAVVQAALPWWPAQSVQGELGWGAGQTAETDEAALADRSTPKAGETVLDRLHQSMLLFSAGRTEALKRFLVEDGIGQDQRFWRLAQALSALYPMGSDEKRWVDGVLARKKGWGL